MNRRITKDIVKLVGFLIIIAISYHYHTWLSGWTGGILVYFWYQLLDIVFRNEDHE
jgi:hypothetical protein